MGKKLPVFHQEGDIGECLIVHKLLTQVHLHSTTSMCTNDSTVGPSDAGLRPLSVQHLPNLAQPCAICIAAAIAWLLPHKLHKGFPDGRWQETQAAGCQWVTVPHLPVA